MYKDTVFEGQILTKLDMVSPDVGIYLNSHWPSLNIGCMKSNVLVSYKNVTVTQRSPDVKKSNLKD